MEFDYNGTTLTYYTEYDCNDLSVKSIEFGAGISNFSKIIFPNSYCTEKQIQENTIHFTKEKLPDQLYHFIDFECDVERFDFKNKKFDNIIMCNPFGYGFRKNKKLESVNLLNKLGSILNKNGQIYILAKHDNSYISGLEIMFGSEFDCEIEIEHKFSISSNKVDVSVKYPNMFFTQCNYGKKTIPDTEIILKKI